MDTGSWKHVYLGTIAGDSKATLQARAQTGIHIICKCQCSGSASTLVVAGTSRRTSELGDVWKKSSRFLLKKKN